MRFVWQQTLIPLVLVSALVGWRYHSVNDPTHWGVVRVERPLMGTVWNIEVVDRGQPDVAQVAVNAAYRELKRIDDLMSEWKPESPISQVDAAAGQHAVEVPAELRELLERSVRYSQQTEGTFDVTWRGMGHIWHFDENFVPPTEEAVAAARMRVNYRAIRIEGNRIFLPAGMNIGLGGIAKGYAIDRAAQVLARAGFPDSLVDGGGDVLVSGTRLGSAWQVGIQDPRQEHGKILGLVGLSNRALVTSGDYERFRIVNGVRYHHIIDPRTGWPASASIAVTVLAPTAEQGVVLGKAIFILGPEKGLTLARREGLEALLIDPEGKRYATAGFERVFEPGSSAMSAKAQLQ